MGKRILVYDNQQAYFKLLKINFNEGYDFILSDSISLKEVDSECCMALFFVSDEIELLDFARLYVEGIPFVMALSGRDKRIDSATGGNIQFLNLDRLKNELISDVAMLLEKLI